MPPPATLARAPLLKSNLYGLFESLIWSSLCIDSSPIRSTAEEVILSFAGYFPVMVPRLSIKGTSLISKNESIFVILLSVCSLI